MKSPREKTKKSRKNVNPQARRKFLDGAKRKPKKTMN
jgi:hypothetical protein